MCIVRFQFQSLLKLCYRLVHLPLSQKNNPKIFVGLREVGVDLQGFSVVFNRFVNGSVVSESTVTALFVSQ